MLQCVFSIERVIRRGARIVVVFRVLELPLQYVDHQVVDGLPEALDLASQFPDLVMQFLRVTAFRLRGDTFCART